MCNSGVNQFMMQAESGTTKNEQFSAGSAA